MKRIDTSTAVGGRFVDGNKTTGQKATQFSAEWCNQIQEELCNFLAALGVSMPSGLSENEIANAFLNLKKLALHGSDGLTVEYIHNNATYKVTLNHEGLSVDYQYGDEHTVTEIGFNVLDSIIGIVQLGVEAIYEKDDGVGITFYSETNFEENVNFEKDVVVGASNSKKSLTIHGTCKTDLVNLSSIVSISEDGVILADDYNDGDVILVHNTTSTTKKVYCMSGARYVDLKPWCSMRFICVSDNLQKYFSPLSSVDINYGGG